MPYKVVLRLSKIFGGHDFTWKDQSVFNGMSQKAIRAYLSRVIDKIGEIPLTIGKDL